MKLKLGEYFTDRNEYPKQVSDIQTYLQNNSQGTLAADFADVMNAGDLTLLDNETTIASRAQGGGDIFVLGKMSIGSDMQISASSASPRTRVTVANYSCGTGLPTRYATVPIAVGTGSTIYGDVCTNDQLSGACMSQGGLIAGCTVAPPDVNVTQPMSDKTSFTNKIPTPQTASTGGCSSNGSRTWSANMRYGGNVTIGASCVVSVRGDIYITGNLTIDAFAELRVHSSAGTTPPTIVVNGRVTIGENVQAVPNADLAGLRIISFYSTDNNATTGCTYRDTCVTYAQLVINACYKCR